MIHTFKLLYLVIDMATHLTRKIILLNLLCVAQNVKQLAQCRITIIFIIVAVQWSTPVQCYTSQL